MEPGNSENLSLAEKFTLPMIWSPQHLNFKHLYYEKPACNGEISVRYGSVIERFQYTSHFNGGNRDHRFLYSLNLQIMEHSRRCRKKKILHDTKHGQTKMLSGQIHSQEVTLLYKIFSSVLHGRGPVGSHCAGTSSFLTFFNRFGWQ